MIVYLIQQYIRSYAVLKCKIVKLGYNNENCETYKNDKTSHSFLIMNTSSEDAGDKIA